MSGFASSKETTTEMSVENRRQFERLDYRTVGTAYSPESGPEAPEVLTRVWTRDVSLSGAKLSSNIDLSGRRLYLKLLLPQFKDTIIECNVVRRYKHVRESLAGKERVEFLYGVQFLSLHTQSNLDNSIVEALNRGPQD
ncbi:MAG: PilZ domain-containing protein [Planctomycetaceae bacterium]|nr:PilZ domain-containing protein [Planctomycetaceae bacterium]MCA9031192.1 PilZ domain-containing protein [Planctomycetaceae bacterium]MCA9043009.1 PilZ domain-containing protein [Planctomycetaceae bacterium]MCB9953580.1 PilZ domain-containing protein [Planctomycetaceae bacterium]